MVWAARETVFSGEKPGNTKKLKNDNRGAPAVDESTGLDVQRPVLAIKEPQLIPAGELDQAFDASPDIPYDLYGDDPVEINIVPGAFDAHSSTDHSSTDDVDGTDATTEDTMGDGMDDNSTAIPVKRGRGRPPKPKPLDSIPTPRPPVRLFGSDRPKSSRGTVYDFFQYWASLAAPIDPKLPGSPPFLSRITGYLYRKWPVGRRTTREVDHKTGKEKIKTTTQVCRYFDDHPKSEIGILHEWGSGTYHVVLTDSHSRNKIAECWIKNLHDDDYPPIIPELVDWLEPDNKDNRAYIAGLKASGVSLPRGGAWDQWHDKSTDEENDMAGIGSIATKIGEQAINRLFDEKDKQQQQQQSRPRIVTRPIVPVAVAAPSQGAKDFAEAFATVAGILERSRPETPDPLKTMGTVVELAKTLMPPQSSDSQLGEGIKALAESLVTSQQQQTQAMQAMLETVVAKVQPAPVKSLSEQLGEMLLIQKQMRELSGESDDAGAGAINPTDILPAAAKATGLGSWINADTMPLITMALQMVGGIVHNVAVAATKQGNPVAPGQDPSMMAMQPQSQYPQAQQPQQQSQSMQQQQQPMQMQQQQSTGDEMANLMEFANQLKEPLLRSMNEGRTGVDFAQTFIEWYGRPTYDQVKGSGAAAIIQLLGMVPELKAQMTKFPGPFEVFLNEFLEADRILAEEEEAADKADSGMAATGMAATATTGGVSTAPAPAAFPKS